MIKSLRRKFIVAAMFSLLILVVIIIGGIALLGYYQMEQTADSMLQSLTAERRPPEHGSRPPYPAFGYQISPIPIPTGYFVAIINSNGQIQSVDYMGMMEITEDDAHEYINTALSKESIEGKIGS